MALTIHAGTVRHEAHSIHHAVPRPRRSEAQEAIAKLSRYLETIAKTDIKTARELRKVRDTLAVVVATAY